jgi:RNA methyltransferase, TrmH family
MANSADLTEIFRRARRDPALAVLEGLHPIKHALRFDAQIVHIAITAPEHVRTLVQALAPDVAERMLGNAHAISPEAFATLARQAPVTGVIAVARRPSIDLDALLAEARPAPIVLLERPRDLGNIGACVRVAAAADAAAVLTTGTHDPWDPAALRGSAGLHFALPVAHLADDALERIGPSTVPSTGPPVPAPAPADRRPLVAVDPNGAQLNAADLPARAILAFGAERQGLSTELLDRADMRVSLPMRAGVSSLNLATSVAAVLYGWRLAVGGVGGR